ncbi:hypothetical protein C0J52_16721 [Blattella germanica]|nr:hypothetical protein C0J52_16721 [Blattella germanica]
MFASVSKMAVLPFRLSHLALEVFGKYISNLIMDLVTLSQDTTIQDFGSRYLQPTCDILEEMIQEAVPSTLANEVTEKLLTHVLHTYNHVVWRERLFLIIHKQQTSWYEEVVVRIASATFHPCTTVFEYNKRRIGIAFSPFEIQFLNRYLDKVLQKVRNIKVMRISVGKYDTQIIFDRKIPAGSLEEFSSHFSSDETVKALSNSCKHLKHLDVSGSKVTDKSVEDILNFKHLKSLIINNTKLSSDAVTKILKDGSNSSSKLPLELLKAPLASGHITLLSENFPNLISLEILVTEECSLTPLKSLKYLKSLSINCETNSIAESNFTFSGAKELLLDIGKQLRNLCIQEIEGTDLKYISETCPYLQCISLHFNKSDRLGFTEGFTAMEYSELRPLPEFHSVQYCELTIYNMEFVKYFVSKLVNLKELKITLFKRRYDSLMKFILDKMLRGDLQTLHINRNKIRISGHFAVINNVNGSTLIVKIQELECIMGRVSSGLHIESLSSGDRIV